MLIASTQVDMAARPWITSLFDGLRTQCCFNVDSAEKLVRAVWARLDRGEEWADWKAAVVDLDMKVLCVALPPSSRCCTRSGPSLTIGSSFCQPHVNRTSWWSSARPHGLTNGSRNYFNHLSISPGEQRLLNKGLLLSRQRRRPSRGAHLMVAVLCRPSIPHPRLARLSASRSAARVGQQSALNKR
jgi:hypothetical protein